MNIDTLRYRVFQQAKKLVKEDQVEEAWNIAYWMLPVVLEAMAGQVKEDMSVECFTLRNGNFGAQLVNRNQVLNEKYEWLKQQQKDAEKAAQ